MAATILVVDDEPQMRRALSAGLRANGFTVELAASGEETLDRLALVRPDVVLLDLTLPGIDGLEVVSRIREWSPVPIIVLSARESERDKVIALDRGADDYLTKPFGMPELLARIRVAVRHAAHAPGADAVFVDGDLRVDFASRVVTLSEDEIHLTPIEYSLLRELIVNAGKVMTHHMLLGRVWGPSSVNDTQYLRTYINQLRRKLAPSSTSPGRIVTEPGIGYRYRRVTSGADLD